MSIAYIRLSRVLLKIRKNTHRYRKLLIVPMWTVSLFLGTWDGYSSWKLTRTVERIVTSPPAIVDASCSDIPKLERCWKLAVR